MPPHRYGGCDTRVQCLVTGATGFIGRKLVPSLVARGCRVTALVRQSSSAFAEEAFADEAFADEPFAGENLVVTHSCDLQAATSDLHCEGIDVVFHLAAVAHQYATPAQYAAVNVEATLRLAQASLAGGVRRFVYFSSVKACSLPTSAGERGHHPLFDNPGEGTVAPLHDYATSKAMAEYRLRELCRQSPMELVIVRPALVYDVDSPGHLAWLRRWVDLHMPAPPDVGARSMVSREDLVRLAGDLLDLSRPMPAQITATDGEVYSLRRLHAALCEARRRRPWLPSPPPAVWRVFAGVFDRLVRIAPGSTWQRFAGRDIHEQQGFDAMGFTPRLNFEACLAGRNGTRS